MHDNEQFLKFGDLQKKFDESWPKDLKKEKAEEEKRNAQKIADEKAAGEAVAQEATS